MNRLFAFFLLTALTISCKKENLPRTLKKINITEFKRDSASIRAIYPINKTSLYYASSNGVIGFTKSNGDKWGENSFINIKDNDTLIPNFRSITYNGTAVFALSIGNPALLYKLDNTKKQTTLVYKEVHDKVFYDSMKFFADGKHGIAVGDPTENCASIILTSDGGNTWNKLSCENLPIFEEGEAFFAASNTNIKIINNTVWIASGGTKARILKSTDYGNTWQIYDTPIIQGNGPQGIYSIDFYDELNGIAIGGNYAKPNDNCANKAITSDGGKTWTLVADNQNPNYKSCVQYVPDTNGKEIFAVGKTGISFSNDGGHTWTEVSSDSYYTIKFVDKNTAWLSGDQKIGKLVLK
ncbi:oxidoreductase [Tenacibaculum sp. HL-MS23]|uniref:WD40/YVTN/BNR-like repeat-containing protein n=1 Tax=Tenacibaculum TaxID=104267 RepID=UPI0023AF0FC8|nr:MULTISPECIES: oxidoreductase [Tenacibaculum]WNW02271.1 oxidoreductase [Tenacibaculum sp. HL-MS23]